MRLNLFLNENVTTSEVLNILQKKCKKNLIWSIKNKFHIYRGIKTNVDFIIDYEKNRKVRKSANTTDYTNILVSEILLKWKEFPKRNKSLICTTDHWYTNQYGDLYHVIPFDNSKIAICPTYDFWDSFQITMKKLNLKLPSLNINMFNDYYFEGWNIKETKSSIEKHLKTKISKLLSIIDDNWISEDGKEIKKSIIKIFGEQKFDSLKFYDIVEYILDPDLNKFKIINSVSEILNNKNEVWLDSDAVLINDKNWNEICDLIIA